MGSPASSIAGGGGGSIPDLGDDAFFNSDNEAYLRTTPQTAAVNTAQPLNATDPALTLRGAVGQSAPLLVVENSAGTDLAQVTVGQILAPSGIPGAPGLGFIADPATGINLSSPGVLQFVGGNWQLDYQSLRCFRDTACVVLGSLEDAVLKWAATGAFRLLASGGSLGTILGGRLVRARTADLTLTAAESWIHYTNTGAAGQVVFTLPAATLANEVGLEYFFTVTAAQNLRVAAAGTDTIQIAGQAATAGGGNVNCATIAGTLRITCTSTGKWTAHAGGTWT